MKRYEKICMMLVSICLLTLINMQISKAANPSDIKIQNYSFQKEGLKGKASVQKEIGKISLSLDTKKKKKGYYSSTLFLTDSRNVSKYGGFTTKMINKSNHSLRLNIAMNTKSKGVVVVKNGASVILNQNGVTSYQRVANDCFEIPAGYKGSITIPFYGLADQKNQKLLENEIEDIYGVGFIFVLQEQAQNEITISDMSLIEEGYLPAKKQIALVQIKGEESMLRPIEGSSVEEYKVSAFDMVGDSVQTKAKLSLQRHYDFVRMTSGGKLEVDANAQDDSVVLCATTSNGVVAKKKVYLQYSWTKKVMTENGYNAAIAKPSEVKPLLHQGNPLMNDRLLLVIRVVGVIGVGMFFLHYISRRKRYKRELKKGENNAIFK
ncbi:predicted membrane protein [Lachnospiraceae bacterium KM106-2]|nr:predicted membrane protein [Lachnospiraceae bacterium KM106-2]